MPDQARGCSADKVADNDGLQDGVTDGLLTNVNTVLDASSGRGAVEIVKPKGA